MQWGDAEHQHHCRHTSHVDRADSVCEEGAWEWEHNRSKDSDTKVFCPFCAVSGASVVAAEAACQWGQLPKAQHTNL